MCSQVLLALAIHSIHLPMVYWLHLYFVMHKICFVHHVCLLAQCIGRVGCWITLLIVRTLLLVYLYLLLGRGVLPKPQLCPTLLQIRLSSAAAECNRLLLELGDMVRQIQVFCQQLCHLSLSVFSVAMCSGGIHCHAMSDMSHV